MISPVERAPGDYVVRETRTAPSGLVVYTLVDLAGNVSHVSLPKHLTVSEWADPVLRHHVSSRSSQGRRP